MLSAWTQTPQPADRYERKQEQALKVLRQQVLEATLDMEREEAAEFFGELADWAYAQQEAMLIDEPEMQNYDED